MRGKLLLLLFLIPIIITVILYSTINQAYFTGAPDCNGKLHKYEGFARCIIDSSNQWVSYQLTRKETMGYFNTNKQVPNNTIQLAPSADFRWSKEALIATLEQCNLILVNDTIKKNWLELENAVKDSAIDAKELYIISGIYNDEKKQLLYKATLKPDMKSSAFIIDLKKNQTRSISVDSLERLIAIDLFRK